MNPIKLHRVMRDFGIDAIITSFGREKGHIKNKRITTVTAIIQNPESSTIQELQELSESINAYITLTMCPFVVNSIPQYQTTLNIFDHDYSNAIF